MHQRPPLTVTISLQDFSDFYWLKEELVSFCKATGIDHRGDKLTLAARITHFLTTGEKETQAFQEVAKKSKSTFNWKNAPLTLTTILTDNYKNTENVRHFFEAQLGKSFKFNVRFMNWCKQNHGKTLNDAVVAYQRIQELKKTEGFQTTIAPQFEYNTYMRDFLKDNPTLTTADARKYWLLKRKRRGSKKYTKNDLKLEI